MSIELVGLAYDAAATEAIWSDFTIRQVYDLILKDDFRRKVDPRSMLYHKGQLDLLTEIDAFLREGGESYTLLEFIARRFAAGVEDFPGTRGDLVFDFQLIRHFASLAMVHDYLVADPFLRELLRKVGFLKNGAGWSLLEVRDFDGVSAALRDADHEDIAKASQAAKLDPTRAGPADRLVQSYMEFLAYARNNGLAPFFYNSQSDFRRWGNLVERHNRRAEAIVDSAMRPKRKKSVLKELPSRRGVRIRTLSERIKFRKECDALVGGLSDSDPLIRQKSAESLGKIAEPGTLPSLVKALSDEEPEVRQEVVRGIGAIEGKDATAALLRVVDRHQTAGVRLTAAYLLRERGVKEVVPLLLNAIESGQPHCAVVLAFHPAFPRDSGAHRRVIRLAKHTNPSVRRDGAFLLGRMPMKKSLPVLKRLTEDQDDETRVSALYSLYRVSPRAASPVARKWIASGDQTFSRAGHIVDSWTALKRAR